MHRQWLEQWLADQSYAGLPYEVNSAVSEMLYTGVADVADPGDLA
jgi:hypothetical protein